MIKSLELERKSKPYLTSTYALTALLKLGFIDTGLAKSGCIGNRSMILKINPLASFCKTIFTASTLVVVSIMTSTWNNAKTLTDKILQSFHHYVHML
jgi:hypothetical protein